MASASVSHAHRHSHSHLTLLHVCLQIQGEGMINKDLPSCWECPKCVQGINDPEVCPHCKHAQCFYFSLTRSAVAVTWCLLLLLRNKTIIYLLSCPFFKKKIYFFMCWVLYVLFLIQYNSSVIRQWWVFGCRPPAAHPSLWPPGPQAGTGATCGLPTRWGGGPLRFLPSSSSSSLLLFLLLLLSVTTIGGGPSAFSANQLETGERCRLFLYIAHVLFAAFLFFFFFLFSFSSLQFSSSALRRKDKNIHSKMSWDQSEQNLFPSITVTSLLFPANIVVTLIV